MDEAVLNSILESAGDEPWLRPTGCWYCHDRATLALHHTSHSGNHITVCRRHREEGLRQIAEWEAPLLGIYLNPVKIGRVAIGRG